MRKLIVTFFGSGLSPVAPGTAGSLATVVLLYAVLWAHPSYVAWQAVLIAGLVVSSALNVILGPWAISYFGKKDPQSMVIDEVAGICLTAILSPLHGPHGLWTLVAVFAAFRLFDITKPPPARQLEHLPAGWGILCDGLGRRRVRQLGVPSGPALGGVTR